MSCPEVIAATVSLTFSTGPLQRVSLSLSSAIGGHTGRLAGYVCHLGWLAFSLKTSRIYIVFGKGWVQKEGGPIEEVGPGDVVWIPPRLRHWRGASTTEPMVQFAVAEALDASAVTWMEKVTDKEYRVGPRPQQ